MTPARLATATFLEPRELTHTLPVQHHTIVHVGGVQHARELSHCCCYTPSTILPNAFVRSPPHTLPRACSDLITLPSCTPQLVSTYILSYTSSDTMDELDSAQKKLLKSTKFPPEFNTKVDKRKIQMPVMTK
jgi:hypothetical protein